MKVEIEIDVPEGYRPVRYGKVNKGEWSINKYGRVAQWDSDEQSDWEYIILEKIVKQGEDLIGCLCGVDSYTYDRAKENAKKLKNVRYILGYIEDEETYTSVDGGNYSYAYPVPQEQLLKLAERIGE